MTEQETPEETERERAWINGHNAAWRSVLTTALGQLSAGGDPTEDDQAKLARLVAERVDTVRMLRRISEQLDCNDWPDGLCIADVLKRIGRRLELEV